MCLASAYFNNENGTLIMKDIAHLKADGDNLELETLFGERKAVRGKIIEVDFFSSKIFLEQNQATVIEGDSYPSQLEK
ncbi:MAG: CooT family nickel-binding protein [Syntrophales bacterium]